MAELSAAAPAGGAAFERDVLLATKLHMPRSQQGFVVRLRLVEALDEGLSRRLILVCAPAGFGKTALLADWARRGSRPVAWLSLDAGDNDPARFWRHAVAALDRVQPGIGERAGPLLGPPAPLSFEGLVTALINELAAQPGEDKLLLVLDDYHLIDTQQVQDSLVFLLEHLPSSMHLGLGGRAAAGRAVAARATGQSRVRGRVQWQPPLRPGLPNRRGAGTARRAATRVLAGDLGAGPAIERVVRCSHRPHWQPGDAGAGRAGGPLHGAAG